MFKLEDLNSGIEFVNSSIKVEAKLHGRSAIYVNVFPEPYSNSGKLMVTTTLRNNSITIDDLTGNEFGSDYHNKGYGRLAVNTVLSVAKHYFQSQKINLNDVLVRGTLSPQSEKHTGEDERNAHERRVEFWKSFGLIVEDEGNPYSRMEGALDKLVLREPKTSSIRTVIPLNEFKSAKV